MLALMLVGMCISCFTTLAQQPLDTLKVYHIETTDGNEFVGRVTSENSEFLMLVVEEIGTLTIYKSAIKRITEVETRQMHDGKLWFENPQAARYFWAPNGYGLRKGEGYFQNVWVLFNQVSYGLTNHFSIGVGLMPLFLFGGAETPIWVTPKFSFPVVKDKLNIGVGTLFATVTGVENSSFGVLYGQATLGSRDKNMSLGIGYGYSSDTFSSMPVFNISGVVRTGQRGYFITENYVISSAGEVGVILFVGGRRIIKRVSLDYGLLMPIASDIDSFVAVPWLGIVIPFGK
jgi:hypothetical protein